MLVLWTAMGRLYAAMWWINDNHTVEVRYKRINLTERRPQHHRNCFTVIAVLRFNLTPPLQVQNEIVSLRNESFGD
jgi:hypothetical protein